MNVVMQMILPMRWLLVATSLFCNIAIMNAATASQQVMMIFIIRVMIMSRSSSRTPSLTSRPVSFVITANGPVPRKVVVVHKKEE